ncbi:hypothetical protein [Casimicrobium huifangae]|uniref:hypothetical protein n=1 Tax=Casimicrobium huifangae TaxID=2591109 RepID=UPI0037830410
MRASNPAGIDVPWVLVRRRLADKWHVPPWVVDEAPTDEVLTELEIMNIEAQSAKK